MEAKASVKNIKISPRKARLVVDLVRGKSVKEAVAILDNTNKSASTVVSKLVKSAAANAVNNNKMDAEKLYISYICVTEGRRLKRSIAGGKGSAFRIIKRTCHIDVVVAEA